MTLPTGLGIGATHAACAVRSLTRAAGLLLINTVAEPLEMMPGPPGTQLGKLQVTDWLPTTAAGLLLILTLVEQLLVIARGIAGWATGVGTGAAGWMGEWQ